MADISTCLSPICNATVEGNVAKCPQCGWAMMVMGERLDFDWLAESAKDFLTRPGGWPETRYEAKARREGREVWYFRYRRC